MRSVGFRTGSVDEFVEEDDGSIGFSELGEHVAESNLRMILYAATQQMIRRNDDEERRTDGEILGEGSEVRGEETDTADMSS